MKNIEFIKTPKNIKEALLVCPYCKGDLVHLREDYNEDIGLDEKIYECIDCERRSKQIMEGGVV